MQLRRLAIVRRRKCDRSRCPGPGFIAVFFEAERGLDVDAAPVRYGCEQDKYVGRFIANVCHAAGRVLRLSLQFANGSVKFADFFAEPTRVPPS
jgi:hypothetical protein